ncbi:TonB-dependent receptor [Permianibacter sp. IMCC34836]|uniref:TonB-dependent receptor plug domain-containing protein n=1 Tax=Permianibacter fluminis TaxID=2738515 RepID=UPI0015533B62|nr:TonB-dependent receptor [Permianibacter fluminis]NQD38143.1 TonB-dependent receptor [Permianibacter fluminis]
MTTPQSFYRRCAPLSLAIATVLATPAITLAADTAGDEERVQVVGSRVAVRSENESAVPVDLISGDDLRKAGATDVGNALELIAPSFNFVEMSVADGSDHVKPAMLRGMGPDQTLVLVNGKRRHQSALIHIYSVGRGTAGTDLNSIPMSAVERIEVLRDGASAQYGSDAIAGVINVVLKKNLGTSVSQTFSQTSEGDGDTSLTSVNTGFGVGEGVLNLTAEYKKADPTNRAEPDPSGNKWRFGEPELEQKTAFFNFEMPMGSAELYAFGGYSKREAESAGYARCDENDPNSGITYCQTIPTPVLDVHPNGFLPLINSDVEDKSIALGLRFDIGNWNADLSVVDGENSFGFFISNSQNFSYGYGPDNDPSTVPTSADAGELMFGQRTLNFDVSGDVSLGSKTLALAFGAEMRREESQITAGDEYSWQYYGDQPWGLPDAKPGIQVFPGWSPAQANHLERDSSAIYGEASMEFTDSFRMEAALRHEDYEDFGTDLSSKLAAYLSFNDHFSMRASIADGFRAPALQQIGYSQLSSQIEAGATLISGIYSIESDVAQQLGIPELKPEDSKSYTLGWVTKFDMGLEATLDIYRIDISDRIAISGLFYPSDATEIDDALPDDVGAAAFFTNAIDTQTLGADLVVNFRHDVGTGRMEYTFASSYNKTTVESIDDLPGVLAGITGANRDLSQVYFDRHEEARIERYSPKNRHTISARHVTDTWTFGAAANYFGSVKTVYLADDPTYDYVDDGAWIFDLNLAYDFGNGFNVRGMINNVADKYPKKQHGDWNGVTLPYSLETAQWGYNGRTYSLVGSYTF